MSVADDSPAVLPSRTAFLHYAVIDTHAVNLVGMTAFTAFSYLRNRTFDRPGLAKRDIYVIAESAGWVVSTIRSQADLAARYPDIGRLRTVAEHLGTLRRFGWIRTFRYRGSTAYVLGVWGAFPNPWGVETIARADQPTFFADVWVAALDRHLQGAFGDGYAKLVHPTIVRDEAARWSRAHGQFLPETIQHCAAV